MCERAWPRPLGGVHRLADLDVLDVVAEVARASWACVATYRSGGVAAAAARFNACAVGFWALTGTVADAQYGRPNAQ
jgi:hypothetical protein